DALRPRRVRPGGASRGVAEVDELGVVLEPDAPAELARPPAEIDVLGVHEAARREAAESLPGSGAHGDDRADRAFDLPRAAVPPVGAPARLEAIRDETADPARPGERHPGRRKRPP